MVRIVGGVFFVLAIIAVLVATGLSEDGIFDWAAEICALPAFLFIIVGVCFAMGRRGQT